MARIKGRGGASRFVRGRRRPILIVVAATLVLLLIAAGLVYAKVNSITSKMKITGEQAERLTTIMQPRADRNTVTILLVGSDRRPGWKTARADALALLQINLRNKSAYMLSIPRDARVEIPGHGYDKVNYSYNFGGAPLLVETVEEYLDRDIDYYLQLDYVGFEKAIDAVGGVSFTVDKGWYSYEFGLQVRHGRQHRMGKEALAVLKSREFSQGDVQRVKHQQVFLKEVSKQLLESPMKLPRIAEVVAENAETNLKPMDLIRIGAAVGGPGFRLETVSLPGTVGNAHGATYNFIDEQKKARILRAIDQDDPAGLK